MFRVAARLSRAVTPASAARPLRAVPSTLFQSSRTGVQRAMRPSGEGLGRGAPASPSPQNRILSSMYFRRSAMATRSCCMVSRSRTVTVWVGSVSKSTQMQKGVPISS